MPPYFEVSTRRFLPVAVNDGSNVHRRLHSQTPHSVSSRSLQLVQKRQERRIKEYTEYEYAYWARRVVPQKATINDGGGLQNTPYIWIAATPIYTHFIEGLEPRKRNDRIAQRTPVVMPALGPIVEDRLQWKSGSTALMKTKKKGISAHSPSPIYYRMCRIFALVRSVSFIWKISSSIPLPSARLVRRNMGRGLCTVLPKMTISATEAKQHYRHEHICR